MSQPVVQLTYISSRHPSMERSEVERILVSARLHNRRNGLTGLLLFNGHRFLQHIEGPADAVDETLERIRADTRHRAIVLLGRTEAEFRAFSSWSMAFEMFDGRAPERHAPLVEQVREVVAGVDPRIGNHFLGYARLTSTRAA